jgi:histidine triad (HIT) family protein
MDIFCKIINKETPSKIIYEDDLVIAIEDLNPVHPGHFLVIPKIHSKNLKDISNDNYNHLMLVAKRLANETIERMGVYGFRMQINNEKESGQEIFHTHVHIIPSIE